MTESDFWGAVGGVGGGRGESWQEEAVTEGYRVGGSLAVGTRVQPRKGKIISPSHHQK